jgi:Kef-type K+ transport system membrane component KefB
MHAANILEQIAIAIVAATVGGFLAHRLRQPLILGYIVAGVIVGPTQGFGLISPAEVEPIAELGLILLLFMIGLEIDLKKLRKTGSSTVAAGIGQFAICAGLGLLVMPMLGFRGYAALYLAVAAALSSTMIVVKLLYDKEELDTGPGRITLGILVFQDIWAILFLSLQPNLQNPSPAVLAVSVGKGATLVAIAFLISRYALPALFRSAAKLPELMVIGALGWCFLIVTVAGELELSREMGALIAGVALSTFPYNLNVVAKVISLRDFFITLFFVTLGAQIPSPTLTTLAGALMLSGFLVASRFLSVTPILHALGNGNRVSFIPALNLAQISEFSLVICTLGVGYVHITDDVLTVVVFTLVLTSVASTYGILYNYEIFRVVAPALKRLGLRDLDDEAAKAAHEPIHVVFLGLHREGSSVLHELLVRRPHLAAEIGVIDFNPVVRDRLKARGIRAIYGDLSHGDTLHHAEMQDAVVVICALPDSLLKGTSNARLLEELRHVAPDARVIVTAEDFDAAKSLYRAGASFVYVPRLMGAREMADVILQSLHGDPEQERHDALAMLDDRVEVLP